MATALFVFSTILFATINVQSSGDYFRVIVLGDAEVGKSALVHRFKHDLFKEEYIPTVLDYQHIRVGKRGEIELNIWDTSSQPRYQGLVPIYLKSAQAVIIVYDISNKESFQSVNKWWNVSQSESPGALVILVANKMDLDYTCVEVTHKEGVAKAKQIGAVFVETSVKTGDNVQLVLDSLLVEETEDVPDDDINDYFLSIVELQQVMESEEVLDIDGQTVKRDYWYTNTMKELASVHNYKETNAELHFLYGTMIAMLLLLTLVIHKAMKSRQKTQQNLLVPV